MTDKNVYQDQKSIDPPFYWKGTVVKGFRRGSSELGVPTANLDPEEVGQNADEVATGVYAGWATVGSDTTVYKMVLNIGWNPYYKNEKKTIEPHLLAEFKDDFYGDELRLVVTEFLRGEANFSSLDELIETIHQDIRLAKDVLEQEKHLKHKTNRFLLGTSDDNS